MASNKFSFLLSLSIPSSLGLFPSACVHGQRPRCAAKTSLTTDENVEKVLVNGVAEIKCDVSSSIDGDQVLLVVWYKNNLPIYR
jgi:hypothetical protein